MSVALRLLLATSVLAWIPVIVADAAAAPIGVDWWGRLMKDGVPLGLLGLAAFGAWRVWSAIKPKVLALLDSQIALVNKLAKHAETQLRRDAARTAAEFRRLGAIEVLLSEIRENTKNWRQCQNFHEEARPVLQELVDRLPIRKHPPGENAP